MSPGYQMVQSNHATADIVYHLAFNNPTLLHEWKRNSNSIITLSVKDVEELNLIHNKFKDKVTIEKFYEPDVNEFTSIAFIADDSIRRKLSYLPLSLKNSIEYNKKDYLELIK